MERRKALSIAGVVVATLAAASIAMAANLGLLGLAEADDDVGKLNAENVSELSPSTSSDAGDTPPETEVVVVDQYVTDAGPSGSGAADPPAVAVPDGSLQPATGGAVQPVPGGEYEDEDHEDEDHEEHEEEEHEEEEHEEEEHEEEEHEGDHDDD